MEQENLKVWPEVVNQKFKTQKILKITINAIMISVAC